MPQRWTPDLLYEHFTALRVDDQRALHIKETADAEALRLARDQQTYKDEKANELRSQIERERGSYVTQNEMRALEDKLATQISAVAAQVRDTAATRTGVKQLTNVIVVAAGFLLTVLTIITILTRK